MLSFGRTIIASTRPLLCEASLAIHPPQQFGTGTVVRTRPRNPVQLAAKLVERSPPFLQLILSAVDADLEHVLHLLRAVIDFIPASALDMERQASWCRCRCRCRCRRRGPRWSRTPSRGRSWSRDRGRGTSRSPSCPLRHLRVFDTRGLCGQILRRRGLQRRDRQRTRDAVAQEGMRPDRVNRCAPGRVGVQELPEQVLRGRRGRLWATVKTPAVVPDAVVRCLERAIRGLKRRHSA